MFSIASRNAGRVGEVVKSVPKVCEGVLPTSKLSVGFKEVRKREKVGKVDFCSRDPTPKFQVTMSIFFSAYNGQRKRIQCALTTPQM